MLKRYRRQRYQRCSHCGQSFKLPFFKWYFKVLIDDEWGYTKCPSCRKSGWNRCVYMPHSTWVDCHECAYKYECETYDYRTGCYMGEVERNGTSNI